MPVAGFFKRVKDFAKKGLKGAKILNDIYKMGQPIVDFALDMIPYGSLAKPVLHGISTGIDVADNLVNNVKKGRTKDVIQDVQTFGNIGNTMYNSVNTQLPMNDQLISDVRNNARAGFQSNQQSQPRHSQAIGSVFGNPMNGVITAQPFRQGGIANAFF